MTSSLMEYFNKGPRLGILSTSSKDGRVDSALFGSPRMIDEKTVVMGLGKNRTLANLQQNPNAVFLIMEPSADFTDWKGLRVYLKAESIATVGPVLDAFRLRMAKAVGEEAAKMIHAAVSFSVTEVRPLSDMGQGWEASV